jgi:hypothetical protein
VGRITVALMAIEPDTKDWTWVLDERCPECGFDAASIDRSQMGELVRTNVARWPDLLVAADASTRPTAAQWSALEYGCHVRDVFRIFDQRLRLMLEHDSPAFENWDQDVTAIEERYDLQDPAVVADDLVAAGEAVAATWDLVGPGDWERRGSRSDGSEFTIDTFARYFMHDPVHHLFDVTRGNSMLRT